MIKAQVLVGLSGGAIVGNNQAACKRLINRLITINLIKLSLPI